jgi:drug/metabolite transporter (DMT)-like permease
MVPPSAGATESAARLATDPSPIHPVALGSGSGSLNAKVFRAHVRESGARPLTQWTTHLALFLVQVAFATQAVESKLAMMPRELGGAGIPSHVIAMARMLGAMVCFQAVALAHPRTRIAWRDHAKLAGLSLLGIVLNQLLFLYGLSRTTPQTAALLSVTIPVAAAALSVLFRKEPFSARTLLGLAVAATGVMVLTGLRSIDKGALIIALNCALYAGYVVFSRDVIRRLGARVVVTWIFTWGALLYAPIGMPPLLREAPLFSHWAWGYMIYVVLIPTVLAYLLNAWALGRSNPTLVTVYVHMQPILAGLLAYIQLGTSVTRNMLVAAVFIAAGVAIVSSGAKPHAAQKQAK